MNRLYLKSAYVTFFLLFSSLCNAQTEIVFNNLTIDGSALTKAVGDTEFSITGDVSVSTYEPYVLAFSTVNIATAEITISEKIFVNTIKFVWGTNVQGATIEFRSDDTLVKTIAWPSFSGSGPAVETVNANAINKIVLKENGNSNSGLGELYGITFSPSIFPEVVTSSISIFDATSATMGGNVVSGEDAAVTERGVVYSSVDNSPTIGETGVTQNVIGSGTGIYSQFIAGLSSATTYYVQAYAINLAGVSYGGVESFTSLKYSGGDGSSGTPYQIATVGDLVYLSQHSSDWNKYFIQTADIDFGTDETTVDWDGDGSADGSGTNGFTPIGNDLTAFTGFYNGQSNTIDNLFINRSTIYYIGLFGHTTGSTIQDIGLLNTDITGSAYVGSLVGGGDLSTNISNSYGKGSVNGTHDIGGLVGNIRESSIIVNCYSSVNVSGSGDLIGGLTGVQKSGTEINSSFSTGSVNGSNYTGGLVGYLDNGTVSNCYSTGNVIGETGSFWVGGLVGSGVEGIITNSYSTGTSTARGLLGRAYNLTTTSSFWDTETSGITISAAGTGKTTAEMKTESTFTNWDFAGTWNIQNSEYISYPYLQAFTYDTPGTTPEVNSIPGLEETTSVTWTGATDSDWSKATNWNPELVPTAAVDAIIPAAGVTNFPIISSGVNAAVKNLTNNSTNSNTISVHSGGNLTINGSYTAVAGAGIKVETINP